MLLPPIATEQDTSMTAAVCHHRSFMSTTTTTSQGKQSSAAVGRHRSTSQRRRQTTSSDGSKYGDSSDSRFSWADDEASGGEESNTQTSSPADSRNTNYGPTTVAAPPSQASSSTPSGPFLPPITASSSNRRYNISMSTSPLPSHHRGPRDFGNPISSGTESDPMDRYLLKPLDVTHGNGKRKPSHAKSDSNLPSVGLSRESYDRSWSHGHVTNDVDVDVERSSSPLRRRPIAEETAMTGGSGSGNVVHLPSIHEPRLARNGLHRRSSVVDTLRSTASTFRLATGYKSNFT